LSIKGKTVAVIGFGSFRRQAFAHDCKVLECTILAHGQIQNRVLEIDLVKRSDLTELQEISGCHQYSFTITEETHYIYFDEQFIANCQKPFYLNQY